MTGEQLVIVAQEFCHKRGGSVRIINYAALVAAAAAANARVDGIPVHATAQDATRALVATLTKLEPLSDENSEFAKICGQIYRTVTDGM